VEYSVTLYADHSATILEFMVVEGEDDKIKNGGDVFLKYLCQ